MQGVWIGKGAESGTTFDEVEISLEEPEYSDYDEKVRLASLIFSHPVYRSYTATVDTLMVR